MNLLRLFLQLPSRRTRYTRPIRLIYLYPDVAKAKINEDKRLLPTETELLEGAAFATRFIGRPVELLVERVDPDGTASGWTGEYLRARVAHADVEANQVLRVVPQEVSSDEVLLASLDMNGA